MTATIRIVCPCGREHMVDVPRVATDERASWRPVSAVAKAVGVAVGTVRRLVREGVLEGRQGPRRALLVRELDLLGWLDARRYEPKHIERETGEPVIDLLAVAAKRRRASE